MKSKSDCGGPVIEDRFFEPRASVEPRCDPITGSGHGARNPRVTRLVRTSESNDAEMGCQGNQNSGRGAREDDPASPRQFRLSGAGCGFLRTFDHRARV